MTTRKQVNEWIKQRESMEEEAKVLTEYLTGPGMPGLKGGLIDAEMFPIAGLDHYRIREARHRIAVLNTDHSRISEQIENALHHLLGGNGPRPLPEASAPVSSPEPATDIPFAIVQTVSPGSPAEDAGLRVGDRIISFGDADAKNHRGLAYVGEITQNNVNNRINVSILRENAIMNLELTPRSWSGRGVLGCYIIPM